MTKIKICGIQSTRDINILNKYLPDYAGFVFARSLRQVSFYTCKHLALDLDLRVKRVGVFVNELPFNIIKCSLMCGLDVIQLHGEENDDFIKDLKRNISCEIWRVIRVSDISDTKNINIFSEDKLLLDTYTDKEFGGSGKVFDWSFCEDISTRNRIILAGGLNLENVAQAIKKVKPFAVDVSSGVETDGIKDESKIREFIKKVRGE